MSKLEYIFIERDRELSGNGSVEAVIGETTKHFEFQIVATIDDIVVRDHGNGMSIKIGERKPINLDYYQIADILRCIRMMDARNVSEGHLPLDDAEMFVKVSLK